jgi:hypothetical protein
MYLCQIQPAAVDCTKQTEQRICLHSVLCTSTVHNKISSFVIFMLVLKTGQNSDYNKIFPVDTIMSSQIIEWFVSSWLVHSSI